MHDAHPAGPRVRRIRLRKEEYVDRETRVGVGLGEPIQRTDEVAVADRCVQTSQVSGTVVQGDARPVGVLERCGVDAERGVELLAVLRVVEEERVERDLVLFPRHRLSVAGPHFEGDPGRTGWNFGQPVAQLVNDEPRAFVPVAARQQRAALETAAFEHQFRSVGQELAVDNGKERKLKDTTTDPLLIDKPRRVHFTHAVRQLLYTA